MPIDQIESLQQRDGAEIIHDPRITVYRPWVRIDLPLQDSSGQEELVPWTINDPQGETSPISSDYDMRFRHLRDFQYNILGDSRGLSVTFTLFDNRGDMTSKWLNTVSKLVGNLGNSESKKTFKFQFGWSGRDEFNNDIPISSAEHYLVINSIDTDYTEGGIYYRFEAIDILAPSIFSNIYENYPDMSFRQAVDTLIEQHTRSNVFPIGHNLVPVYTAEFLDRFDVEEKRTWQCNGHSSLLLLQNWISQLSPKSVAEPNERRIGGVVKITDNEKNISQLVFDVSFEPIESTNGDLSQYLFNGKPFHVNPPDDNIQAYGGTGRNSVLSFKPSLSGIKSWAMGISSSGPGTSERTVITPEPTGGVNEGQAIHMASRLGDPTSDVKQHESARNILEGQSFGTNQFIPENIQIEILGVPTLDDVINQVGKYFRLFVWNPAWIDDSTSTAEKWKRSPPRDERFPEVYVLKSISHRIDSEGSFITTLIGVPAMGRFKSDLFYDNGGNT